MLYEIWSLGHKPFEKMAANKVRMHRKSVDVMYILHAFLSIDNGET